MLFVGDIHSNFELYYSLLESYLKQSTKSHNIIQLGDHGLFNDTHLEKKNMVKSSYRLPNVKNYYIRGNHDNPEICHNDDEYLGDYGYIENWDMLFISGAWSIDWRMRTPNVDWWYDEELSIEEFEKVLLLYNKYKPRYVITHDCPACMMEDLVGYKPIQNTKTGHYLNCMLECHKPDKWIFGHHHKSVDKVIDGVNYICVDVNEINDIIIDNETSDVGLIKFK